ncbi:MAG: TolC family protein [Deltaproteobacteria bacterium]|nr:TolC family protein [Deltaproteobacteria bacterium]
MRHLSGCGTIVVLWVILVGLTPAQAKFYTLEESITEALVNNRNLKAIKTKIDQAGFVEKQARTEFLPKLSTSYGYTRFDRARVFKSTLPGASRIAISSQDNFEWRGTVTQPLFAGFAILSSYELAKLGVDQSETEYELARLDLALRIKQAYFDILIAEKAVEVAEKDVASRESNLKMVRNFYEVGIVPVNDLLRAEVELADSKQTLVEVKSRVRVAEFAFNTVLSRPGNAPVRVKDIERFVPERGAFESYLGQALRNRPEIKLLDIALLQADRDARLAKSKFYPEIGFEYNYIKAGDTPDVSGSPFHETNRWEATTYLSWTFFEWGKTRYEVKEKESVKDELIQTKLSLEQGIALEIKDALLALQVAEKNVPATEKAQEQAEENLRVSNERYKAQVTTIIEVMDAQRLLSQARVNFYRAIYTHHLAKAGLMRALGTF